MTHESSRGEDRKVGLHAAPVHDVLAQLSVDQHSGLSVDEAASRLGRYGPNILRHRPPANVFAILLNQFTSPVVYLLLAAAAVALVMGEIIDAIAIAIVLVINAAIGFFTEWQAVRSMEALRGLTAPTSLVRRDGRAMAVPAETLVPGDIVILDAGDVIAADMRVVTSANLAANESALTGESLPVSKSTRPVKADAVLADRNSMLFNGCAITRGTGEAVVAATGMDTELGHITKLVEEAKPERSPLERQLAKLSRDLIWLTLALTAIIGIAGTLAGHDIALMLESAIALAVAAIPEGLPIVATLALARGMLRMARHNAVVERLSAVETLGATTVIMTDKTGTLTENRMHVDRIVTAEGDFGFDRDKARFLADGHRFVPQVGDSLSNLLRSAALCNNAVLGQDGAAPAGDPMEIALLEAAAAGGLHRTEMLETCPEVIEHAFDTATLMMATVHLQGHRYLVAVKGAPEAVLDHTVSVWDGKRRRSFTPAQRRHWESVCNKLASQGLRLLAIAGKESPKAEAPVYDRLVLYGVVGLHDPPRADISAAISDARRAGISIVMVTGDHATTARHIAKAVGLAKDQDVLIEGKDLKPLDEMAGAERQRVLAARIFSRVDPEQKLGLIKLHQDAGEIVAMTGDGVNDAPALKKADIGVAMGLRGTQVAREAADLVLRDDAFSTIIHAVREGRMIYTNIRRFTTYLLSCNLSEILVVGLAVLGGLPLPLLPLQILFLNLVTDVFPALALGTIEADGNVLNRKPRPPGEPILARPQWIAIATYGTSIAATTLMALAIATVVFKLTGEAVTTMCFYTLALAQLWHAFSMRNWRDSLLSSAVTRNRYVWMATILCIAILAAAQLQPNVAAALRLAPLSINAWSIVVLLSLIPLAVHEILALIFRVRRL